MIDFGHIDVPVNITKEFILSKLSDEQIFHYYFGSFVLNKAYASALRVDHNPSTAFFINDDGKLVYHDYARKATYDCFAFVMERYNCDFQTALKKIANDFGIAKDATFGPMMSYQEKRDALSFDRKAKGEKLFQFTILDWEPRHLEFWNRFHITREDLEADKYVYPIGELFINKKRIYNPKDLIWFVYVIRNYKHPFDKSKVFFKTYMPHSVETKWFTNNPNTNPYGYLDLPYKTSTLIITKSKKDLMVLKKIWPDVMGVQNESEGALPAEILNKLSKRYQRIFIWFDSDETGVENCTKFNRYGCGYINTPKDLLPFIKDPAEYAERFGLDNLKDFAFEKLGLWSEWDRLLRAS